MFPAQSLAEALLARRWRVVLSTDPRGARYAGGFPAEVARQVVNSGSFARGGVLAKLAVPPRIAAGWLRAMWAMSRDRPSVVVGFGGYPSIPALGAAMALRIPRLLHEQNGVLGEVNRRLATRVAAVACGTWPTEVPAGAVAVPVGNPVRASVRDRGGAPYIPPGDYPMLIVVIGGSQGARILSQVVPAAVALLPEALKVRLRIAHQARAEDMEAAVAAYDAARIPAEVARFFDDVPRRFSEAQLVIARAGASTVADLTVIGRPAILVPFAAAVRDEQTANARGLVEAGAAILMPESLLTPQALAEQIANVLSNPDGALSMSRAALSLARPDAAETLADLVETVAAGQPVTPDPTTSEAP